MSAQEARDRMVRLCALGVAAGSALLLGGALGFEYVANLPPCELCIYQRIPHALVIPLGLAALATLRRPGAIGEAFLAAAGLVVSVGVGIAIYHLGIEEHWWTGPTACSSASTAPGSLTSIEELARAAREAAIVSCDVVPWSLFGISLAGFNAIFSTALAGLAFAPGLRRIVAGKSGDARRQESSAQVV